MSSSNHYISTHTRTGTATFSDLISPESYNSSTGGTINVPFGSLRLLYATSGGPLFSNTADAGIVDTLHRHENGGLPQGKVTVPHGVAAAVVTLNPGAITPIHRTVSLDMGVVLEGSVEWWVFPDHSSAGSHTGPEGEGEKRVLQAGDTIVQRGTMHRWVNITPGGGVCKLFMVATDAQKVKLEDGRELEEEWLW